MKNYALICAIVVVTSAWSGAEDASDLVPDLTDQHLESLDQWWSDASKPVPFAVAKVVWRLDRLSSGTLSARTSDQPQPQRLAAIRISGHAVEAQRIRIPKQVAESLDFEVVWLLRLRLADNQTAGLLCKNVPANWASTKSLNEPVEADCIVLSTDDKPLLVATNRMRWFPNETGTGKAIPRGWTILSAGGFDANQFSTIKRRNRSSLAVAETESFYEFINAASSVPQELLTGPEHLEPQELLTSSQHIGDFVKLRLETARVQRVHSLALQDRIGQDHYWEIDTFGELGDVRIRVEGKDGREPIEFGYRYPVTIIMLQLPEFLKETIEVDGRVAKVMVMHQSPVEIEGFFYRLWSYDTDFVSSRGGDRQVGPLVVATKMEEIPIQQLDEEASRIGWIGAILFLIGLGGVIIYLFGTERSDQSMKQVRSSSLPSDLSFDSESVKDDPSQARN